MNEITKVELASLPTERDDAATLITIIDRAARDPTVDLDKMDRLLAMFERLKATAAESAFNDAMAQAQAEMEPIKKDCDNPQTRSRYASYAALDRAVRPIYSRHGFGLSFNTVRPRNAVDTDIGVVCYATAKGHTRLYEIDMPADGKGAKGGDVMTRTHATGSGVSYGMRYLLKMIFNLSTEDDDGNAAGGRRRDEAPAQAQQQRQAAPRAEEPPKQPAPHKLEPLKGDTFEAWAARFVKCLDAVRDDEALAQWRKLNQDVLAKVKRAATNASPLPDGGEVPPRPHIYESIQQAYGRVHDRAEAAAKAKAAPNESAKSDVPRSAPAEPAGAPSGAAGQSAGREPKPTGAAPAEAGGAFPKPYIKRTPLEYVAYALGWMQRAPDAETPDNAAIDARWSAERAIRNGLASPVAEDDMDLLHEARGDAKARSKAGARANEAPAGDHQPQPPPAGRGAADGATSPSAAARGLTAAQEMMVADGVPRDAMRRGDDRPAITVDPEKFLKWVDALYKSAKDGDELERVHNRDVEPRRGNLMPPDWEEVMGLYRRREMELAP